MYIADVDKFILEYSYGDSEEVFTMGSSSVRYLEDKLYELLDSDQCITYKIVAVLKEGYLEP